MATQSRGHATPLHILFPCDVSFEKHMAENRRLLDVWIVETNTAYRAVPFETVANWLQQGRLLGEDRVRPAGTQDWFRIDSVSALAPYLPQAEPQRIDDQAEALEPVEADLSWKSSASEEDDDPDMIPLIDITLVLLIFFMMTAAISSGMFAPIETPAAEHQLTTIEKESYFVAIDKDANDQVRYALGKDNAEVEAAGPDMTHISARLKKDLENVRGKVHVNLRADQSLPIEVIKGATLDLQQVESQINAQRSTLKLEPLKLHIAGEVRVPAQ
jgi:biopolymer transport protein ExbD